MIVWNVMIVIGFIADRLTKYWAVTALQQVPMVAAPWLSFSFALNRGVSWSLFHSESSLQFVLVSLLIAFVVGALTWHMWQRYIKGHTVYGEWLVLGGAISNLWDRYWYGGVVDFIMFHYRDWVWPLFNIADCMIVVGIALMTYELLKE